MIRLEFDNKNIQIPIEDVPMYKKVKSITFTDYALEDKNYIDVDGILEMVNDLLYEIQKLKEEKEEEEPIEDERTGFYL